MGQCLDHRQLRKSAHIVSHSILKWGYFDIGFWKSSSLISIDIKLRRSRKSIVWQRSFKSVSKCRIVTIIFYERRTEKVEEIKQVKKKTSLRKKDHQKIINKTNKEKKTL